MPISSDSSPDGELVSSLKTSRHALLSKLSEMAPATVPAASRLECSDDAPQATVELRLTPLMRILRRSRVLLRSALASHCLSLVFVRCFHPSPRRAARGARRRTCTGSGTLSLRWLSGLRMQDACSEHKGTRTLNIF